MAQVYQRSEARRWIDPKYFIQDYMGMVDAAMTGFSNVMAGGQAVKSLKGNAPQDKSVPTVPDGLTAPSGKAAGDSMQSSLPSGLIDNPAASSSAMAMPPMIA